MSCGRHRAESCLTKLLLVGWATHRGIAHMVCHGYSGLYTPQLVPKHLTPIVQRHLELVRAGANKTEQSNSWSDHRNELPSSCEQLPSSVNYRRVALTIAEQYNPSTDCHKGVRSSSSESKNFFTVDQVCPLRV